MPDYSSPGRPVTSQQKLEDAKEAAKKSPYTKEEVPAVEPEKLLASSTTPRSVSNHVTSNHVTSYRVTSYHETPNPVTSCHVTSQLKFDISYNYCSRSFRS